MSASLAYVPSAGTTGVAWDATRIVTGPLPSSAGMARLVVRTAFGDRPADAVWSRRLPVSALTADAATRVATPAASMPARGELNALSHTDPPFYAIFFVIAGAELDVGQIPAMGALGMVYVIGRAGGKFLGARIAGWRLGLEPRVQKFLGFGLQAQAGLAIGLMLAVDSRYPQFATVVSTVVLSSVAVFEMIGPASTRFALLLSAGEVGAAALESADSVSIADV